MDAAIPSVVFPVRIPYVRRGRLCWLTNDDAAVIDEWQLQLRRAVSMDGRMYVWLSYVGLMW